MLHTPCQILASIPLAHYIRVEIYTSNAVICAIGTSSPVYHAIHTHIIKMKCRIIAAARYFYGCARANGWTSERTNEWTNVSEPVTYVYTYIHWENENSINAAYGIRHTCLFFSLFIRSSLGRSALVRLLRCLWRTSNIHGLALNTSLWLWFHACMHRTSAKHQNARSQLISHTKTPKFKSKYVPRQIEFPLYVLPYACIRKVQCNGVTCAGCLLPSTTHSLSTCDLQHDQFVTLLACSRNGLAHVLGSN